MKLLNSTFIAILFWILVWAIIIHYWNELVKVQKDVSIIWPTYSTRN